MPEHDDKKWEETGGSVEFSDLDPRQEALIAALLSEPTRDAAASKTGVAVSTMYRWLQEESFRARLRAAQRDLWEHSMGNVQAATSEAIQTFRKVMKDPESPAAARVSAARSVLDCARSHIVDGDFEERLAKLERNPK